MIKRRVGINKRTYMPSLSSQFSHLKNNFFILQRNRCFKLSYAALYHPLGALGSELQEEQYRETEC
jgi:hypothetical protein